MHENKAEELETSRGLHLSLPRSQTETGINRKTEPSVSVVICTRNRGRRIFETMESVFANDNPSFEVLVIDQSTNDETNSTLQPYRADSRFRYVPTQTQGTGLSRSIGLSQARGEIVLYTDDDCVVPPDWISAIQRVFDLNPQAAVACCSIRPGAHDATQGTIPANHFKSDRVLNSFMGHYESIWMAAGMAVRKREALLWGGFDSAMGPGSAFECGEDVDMVLRALHHGHQVCELSQVAVIHNGFRTFEEYRSVIARDLVGLGAAHAKYLKVFDWRIIPYILYNIFVVCAWQPAAGSLRSGKPQGFRRGLYYARGLLKGLRTGMDRARLTYQPSN